MDQVAASPSQDRSQFRRLFYNKEVRSVFFQIVTVLGVCALIAYIGMNMLAPMATTRATRTSHAPSSKIGFGA